MKKSYIIEYLNENEFRKKERAVKKYNMLAYKKLIFEFYPDFREGIFNGVIKSKNTSEGITKYELKLPTDIMFSKVYEASSVKSKTNCLCVVDNKPVHT